MQDLITSSITRELETEDPDCIDKKAAGDLWRSRLSIIEFWEDSHLETTFVGDQDFRISLGKHKSTFSTLELYFCHARLANLS